MPFNPTSPDQYIGKQLILNSDRIVINSKEDNLLFSNTGFSFSTNGEFHFNTGDNKENIIDTFYKVDVLLLNPIAPPAGPCAPDAAFPGKTAATQSRITGLKARLKDFQSDKVYLT